MITALRCRRRHARANSSGVGRIASAMVGDATVGRSKTALRSTPTPLGAATGASRGLERAAPDWRSGGETRLPARLPIRVAPAPHRGVIAVVRNDGGFGTVDAAPATPSFTTAALLGATLTARANATHGLLGYTRSSPCRPDPEAS